MPYILLSQRWLTAPRLGRTSVALGLGRVRATWAWADTPARPGGSIANPPRVGIQGRPASSGGAHPNSSHSGRRNFTNSGEKAEDVTLKSKTASAGPGVFAGSGFARFITGQHF